GRRLQCRRDWRAACNCSRAGTKICRCDTNRCEEPSTGATYLSARPSRRCSEGCRFSSAAALWKESKRSATPNKISDLMSSKAWHRLLIKASFSKLSVQAQNRVLCCWTQSVSTDWNV